MTGSIESWSNVLSTILQIPRSRNLWDEIRSWISFVGGWIEFIGQLGKFEENIKNSRII